MKRLLQFTCWACSLVTAHLADANAPACRYALSNGTVHDTRTNLTWQQALDPRSFSVSEAVAYCSGLALDGGGWRLPKISELASIADRTQSNPAIDLNAFPGTPSEAFWSSSPSAATENYSWSFSFVFGGPGTRYSGERCRVRCVR